MINLTLSDENDFDYEMLECEEHGEFPADEVLCPGCEAAEQLIDEAIEKEHEKQST